MAAGALAVLVVLSGAALATSAERAAGTVASILDRGGDQRTIVRRFYAGDIDQASARAAILDLRQEANRGLDRADRHGLERPALRVLRAREAAYQDSLERILQLGTAADRSATSRTTRAAPSRLALADIRAVDPGDPPDLAASTAALRQSAAAGAAVQRRLERIRSGMVTVCAAALGLLATIAGRLAILRRRRTRQSTACARERRRDHARYRALVDKAADLVFITDGRGRVRYLSPSAERYLGTWLRGDRVLELQSVVHADNHAAFTALLSTLPEDGEAEAVECRLRSASGVWRVFEIVATDLRSDSAIEGVVLSARDVTERRELEQKVHHQAMHDGLTGLPNRILFSDRLDHALSRAARSGAHTAVLYIDLDEFKAINDTMGHMAGDTMLKQVTERLNRVLRWGDTLCRLGGDEFAILLEETKHETAQRIGQRVLETLGDELMIGAVPIRTSASVGLAVSGDESVMSGEQLLSAADVAMYVAKRGGRNRLIAYDAEMQVATRRWARLLGDLRGALEREELWVAYQPIVYCEPGLEPRIVGVEALMRWESPSWGAVNPAEFIPLAEEGGLISALGDWVLLEAASTIAALNATRPNEPPIRVAVNVSVRQLDKPDVVPHVLRKLEEAGLSPTLFVMELTESLMLHESSDAILQQLRAQGVRIALDDFGTGYASLAQLGRFAVDQLKIDKEFVQAIGRDHERGKEQLTASIVSLGTTLGLDIVAEGVETPEQLARLQELGCRRMQGYLFGKPMPGRELRALLALPPADESPADDETADDETGTRHISLGS